MFGGVEVAPEVCGGSIEGFGGRFIPPLEVVMMGCNWLRVVHRGVGLDFVTFECLLYAICSMVADKVVEVFDVREARMVSGAESGRHCPLVGFLQSFIGDFCYVFTLCYPLVNPL
jgi:hypothetical protein